MHKREIKRSNWIFDNIENSITSLKDLNMKNNVNQRLT